MKKYSIPLVLFLVYSCGGGNSYEPLPPKNSAPTTPVQIYPNNGLLCTENPLEFTWNPSNDSEGDSILYEIEVATNQNFSTDVQTKTTSNTTVSFALIKGVAYYWKVRAKDNKNNFSEYSSIWNYYTEGVGVSNHLPFIPTLIKPTSNAIISDISTTLEWSSIDVDNDPLSYNVYFGDVNPPVLILENTNNTSLNVDLPTAATYYWKIVVKDDNGGQAIGQIWSFESQ